MALIRDMQMITHHIIIKQGKWFWSGACRLKHARASADANGLRGGRDERFKSVFGL